MRHRVGNCVKGGVYMITISNHTGNTVNIYNNHFSVQLCADKTIDVSEESLMGDFELHFYYNGPKNMRRKVEEGLEKGGIRKKVYYKYEIVYEFPVATVLNVENLSQLILEAEEVSLRKLLLFKTVHIKKIICKSTPYELAKTKFEFFNEEDKRHFIKLMRFVSAITFPAALLAIFALLAALIMTEYTVMEKITFTVFLLGFIIVALEDFYYTIKARNWGIMVKGKTHNTGDGSLC